MIIKQITNFTIQIILLLGILIIEINGKCFQLTDSKSCPGFANFSIDTENGVFPLISQPHYTDVESFDAYIKVYADVLARNFTQELIKDSTCTTEIKKEMETYAISHLRHLTTFACNFILIGNNKCQTTKPYICKETCDEFSVSFQSFTHRYQNYITEESRDKNNKYHMDRCSNANTNFSAVSNCVMSMNNEESCGFKTNEANIEFCEQVRSGESCCGKVPGYIAEQNTLNGTPAQEQSSFSENPNNSQVNVNNNSQQTQNESKSGSKLWIIISIACALLVVSALVYFYKKGETLDSENKSYNDENQFPPFRSMNDKDMGYSQNSNSFNGNKMNYNTNDVLINRNEMNIKMNEPIIDDFKFKDENFNYTSNIPTIRDNEFGNTALYTGMGPTGMGAIGMGAAAIGAAGLGATTVDGMNAKNKDKEIPKPQMVNMTNIEPPESQEPNQTPEIKIDEMPKPQMVNMTNIMPPESQEPNSPSLLKADEIPKPQMVNMTEIPEPEMQLNRNTKFLSSYSEAPSNQHISSQFYGESEHSFDFTNSKLELPKSNNKTASATSSALFSNRSSTDKELNSTPYIAIHTYEPQLNDELLLELNDIIEVVYVYDDGWVWGINTRTNESGACPMLCLEKIEGEAEDFSIDERMKSVLSARDSSMISRDSVPGRRDSILKFDGLSNMRDRKSVV